MNKNIIAIETSTELCSISIYYKNNIYNKYKYTKLKNSKYVLILISKLINKKKIKLNNIDIIAFNKGPGSIIGIRIAYIISKIFNFKYKNIKIIKINTSLIISENYFLKNNKNKNINIIIYNNINNIYNYIFKKNKIIYKNKISLNKFNLYIKNINKKIKLIVNKYQTKKKILNIIKIFKIKNIKNIKIIYPKSKYIIYILKKLFI